MWTMWAMLSYISFRARAASTAVGKEREASRRREKRQLSPLLERGHFHEEAARGSDDLYLRELQDLDMSWRS